MAAVKLEKSAVTMVLSTIVATIVRIIYHASAACVCGHIPCRISVDHTVFFVKILFFSAASCVGDGKDKTFGMVAAGRYPFRHG